MVEFVPKADPMVRRMLANREDVFTDYTEEEFERQLGRRFEVLKRESLVVGGRRLYRVIRRSG